MPRIRALCVAILFLAPACVEENQRCSARDCDERCKERGHEWGVCSATECWCADTEVCDDGIDNDRDGDTDCRDPECTCWEGYSEETCDDGLDNDCDELFDCDDIEDCGSDPAYS